MNILALFRYSGYLFLLCLLIASNPLKAQWIKTSGPSGYVNSIAVSGSSLIAGTWGSGVFRSSDNGTNWSPVNSGLANPYVYVLAEVPASSGSDSNLFAGTNGGGVFLFNDTLTTWKAINTGLGGTVISAFAFNGSNLIAATLDSGVFLSTNNGTSWRSVNTGLTSIAVNTLAFSGRNLFAGTSGAGLFLSTNNGGNWTEVNNGLTNNSITDIAVSSSLGGASTILFAATSGGGIFVSTDSGTSWSAANTGLTNKYVTKVVVFSGSGGSSATLFASTTGAGIFLSTDSGASWNQANTGLTNNYVFTLSVADVGGSGIILYAGTSNGVWKRPLLEMTTRVEAASTGSSRHFTLNQNYPNPFNPTTMISFNIPTKSYALLKVFDLTGREVATVVSEQLPAGLHSRQWNAEGLPSGIYFYRLQAGKFTQTKKLVFLR